LLAVFGCFDSEVTSEIIEIEARGLGRVLIVTLGNNSPEIKGVMAGFDFDPMSKTD